MVGIVSILLWRGQRLVAPRTVTVERQTLSEEVAFTGNLEPQKAVELSFDQSGILAQVAVAEDVTVAAGQVLGSLDAELSTLELAAARAERASAQVEAEVAWQNSDAAYARVVAENARFLEEKRQAVRNAKRSLDQEREVRLHKTSESGDDSAAVASAYATLVAQESVYRAAQVSLATAEKTVAKTNEQARAAAEVARVKYLDTTNASPGDGGLAALEAREALAAARVQRGVLRAPWAGTVVQQHIEAHEYVQAGAPVFSLEGTDGWQIAAAVPETDALTVQSGQRATVTFDALSSDQVWEAEVVSVATSAVVIEGLPTYEVTLRLVGDTGSLRSGLTANVVVQAEERVQVLAVPRRAVVRREGQTYVRVLGEDGVIVERQVETGLVGSTGLVEVRQGVEVGERVVVESDGE